jgi:hypothetical protein
MRTEVIFDNDFQEFVVDARQYSKVEFKEIVRTDKSGIPSDLKLRIEEASLILKESSPGDHVPTRYAGHKDKYMKLTIKHPVSKRLKFTLYRDNNEMAYSVIAVFNLHRKKQKTGLRKAQAA